MKTTNLLSLTAKQFKGNIYAIQSDDEDYEPSEQYLMAGGLGEKDGNEGDDESESSNAAGLGDDVALVLRRVATGDRTESANARTSNRKTVQAPKFNAGTIRSRVPGAEGPERIQGVDPGREAKATRKSISTNKRTPPARRLPVNELFLVASPPDYTCIDPASTYQGVNTQDPIDNSSSSLLKRRISPIDSEEETDDRRAVKTPLTAIRKRIRIPGWRYKRLTTAPKSKDDTFLNFMRSDSSELRGRDGFETSELAVQRRPRVFRKPRTQTPLTRKFDALQLRSGPLPDVEFESPIKHELQTQVNLDSDMPMYGDTDEQHRNLPSNTARSSTRRVSFIDRAREDRIRAELSSISAPARVHSDSEDSDMDDEDDEPMPGEGADADAEADDSEHENEGDEVASVEEDEDVGHQEDPGVTLDFRRPELLPQAAIAHSFQRRHPMEVNERIVEVLDTSPTRRHSNRPSEQARPGDSRPRRLPSILKNSTPMVPDSTSRPEHTEANTRRNSFVEVEESRYFAGAADALREFDPARHKIVPRRLSYFNFGEVHVPDSDHVVPETSQDPLQYANEAQLNVLRRTSEATWMSSTNNQTARDLKTLTRSVSREHGTLSQSVRRRPSLPFQSPTKVQ